MVNPRVGFNQNGGALTRLFLRQIGRRTGSVAPALPAGAARPDAAARHTQGVNARNDAETTRSYGRTTVAQINSGERRRTILDTLRLSNRLNAAGMDRQQAETLADELNAQLREGGGN